MKLGVIVMQHPTLFEVRTLLCNVLAHFLQHFQVIPPVDPDVQGDDVLVRECHEHAFPRRCLLPRLFTDYVPKRRGVLCLV